MQRVLGLLLSAYTAKSAAAKPFLEVVANRFRPFVCLARAMAILAGFDSIIVCFRCVGTFLLMKNGFTVLRRFTVDVLI